ncbi:acetolactate synthase 2 small subunit [Celerinatantimonas sp. YJH-8]|uniref:acetolactate synthase 2 small subunit n=1 Tax=Celerinatantimonas sp. YJH-8 TaxID=3228714 RepID=UPI0038C2143D
MNQYTLEIQTRPQVDVLERVLRITRHRGFRVMSMQMDEADNHQHLNIKLTVCSERAISLLFNQLTKLIDVARVSELCGDQQQKWA